jgi:hypothetical protein
MEFKKLEIEPEGSWIKRTLQSPHTKKTLIYIAIGAVAGFLFTVLTAGKPFAEIGTDEMIQSAVVGAFFGFFITNSPCARNQC